VLRASRPNVVSQVCRFIHMIDTEGVSELLNYRELELALDCLVETWKQVPLKKLRTLRNLHLSLRKEPWQL